LTIIFYEKEYAENLLKYGVKAIKQRDLNFISKLFYEKGLKIPEIREKIEDFCLKTDKNFNLIQSYKMINRALSHAKNNHLRVPDEVIITEDEYNKILTLDNYQEEKFLFAMLVSAKFFKNHRSKIKQKQSKYDQTLYSNSSIRDIQELAGTHFTKKEWREIKRKFTQLGFINPTIIGSNCWAMGICNDTSYPLFVIRDFRNIIAYYQEEKGDNMINCINCNVRMKKNSGAHILCRNCSTEKRRYIRNNWYKNNKDREQ